ncbi:MAG: peroxiredoxin [Trueperaceae bacterium]|nr:peroxiredoxin [Trueperaceae bacterium]
MKLNSGDTAPAFSLPSTQGTQSLADNQGKWTVIYFYPKDDTPGCTTEACDFRDALPGMNAKVIGISPDGLDSHSDFESKYSLPFPLAADENHSVAEAYGAWGEKQNYGKTYEGIIRSTFIIDPDGKVAEAMYNVKATGHVERVREKLASLQKA